MEYSLMADNDQDPTGGDSPYQEYLDRLPEEYRGEVEPVFKDWDAGVTRRFQEASEYKKQWEPIEDLGVQNRDRSQVEWAMQFVDALDNPTAIQQWYQDYANERGLTTKDAAGEESYIDPSVQELVEKQLAARLGPVASQLAEITEWRSARDKQEAEATATRQIESQMSAIQEKHPEEFSREMVEKFVANHMDDPANAVQLAFDDWKSIRSQIEKDVLQGKADTPAGTLSGGQANTEAPPINTLKRASEIALEQLRGNNRT